MKEKISLTLDKEILTHFRKIKEKTDANLSPQINRVLNKALNKSTGGNK